VLPPKVTLGWATPLGVLREERHERLGITIVQRVGCCAKVVDHSRSMASSDERTEESPFVGMLKVEAA
jgi:hypothetical protein